MERFPGPTLVIAGTNDTSAIYVDALIKNASGEKNESLLIEGADHIFGVLGEGQAMAELLIERTATWFAQKL